MEMMMFGVLIGLIVGVAFIGLGVIIGDKHNQELSAGDSDVRIFVPSRDRVDRRNNRDYAENTINVLRSIRTGGSRTEKEAIDYAAECVLRQNVQELGENPYQE